MLDVQVSIIFPFSSVTDNFAPSSSSSPVIDFFENSNIVVSRAEKLVTLINNSYDMYISLRTYNSSFFNVKQAISEAYRVLKKDGIIIISIANGFLFPEDQYIIPGLIIPGTEFVDIYRGFDMIEKLSRELCNNSFEDIQFFPTKVELFLTAKAKK